MNIGRLAIISVSLFQHLNLGYFELIEKCSLPWEPYLVEGSKEGFQEHRECRGKCKGNAFHTNEGKLICFYKKVIAQRIPNPPPGNRRKESSTEKCDCGYPLSGYRKNRISCNISIPDNTRQLCDGICQRLIVYLFKRRNRKTIVHCEQDTRKEFYEMDGQIGNLHHKYKSTKYWICTCGIANYNTRMKTNVHRIESLDFETFEECADPWKDTIFSDIKNVETCAPRCHYRCQQGYGFYYKDKPFCFHQSLSLIKRTILFGGSKDICECGHVQRTHKTVEAKWQRKFLSCEPPIVRNDLKPYACKEYCSESLAYIHRSSLEPWSIRCISEDDNKSPKSEPLSGKCYDAPVEDNSRKNYTICRCGLLKKHKNEILGNRTKVEATKIKLPDIWGIKKKRSKRRYQKLVENKLLELI